MSIFRSFFQRRNSSEEVENPSNYKIYMNFSKSVETKIEVDKKFFDLPASQILKMLKMQDKCLVVETFSKSNGKVIAVRRICDFEKPFSKSEFLPKSKSDDLKYKFCLINSDDIRTISTSQIMQNRFRNQPAKPEALESETKVEKEFVLQLKTDMTSGEERKIHLYLTGQMIYFKYSNDKQRVTHIPLLLIDEITRTENSKLIFTVSSAGAHYYFLCPNSETVRQWINAIQECRQQARIKKTVQTCDQEMKNSANRRMSHMMNFRNLTKEKIFAQKEFRELLFKTLQKDLNVDDVTRSNLNYIFDFLRAYEKDDESDMKKLIVLLEQKGVRFDRSTKLEKDTEDETGYEKRESVDSGISFSDFDLAKNSEFRSFYEKLTERLANFFEVSDFLNALFEECFTLHCN